MVKLVIELSASDQDRLGRVAAQHNVPVERLAEAAVRDLIAEADPNFERIAERVLEKNSELYKRLR